MRYVNDSDIPLNEAANLIHNLLTDEATIFYSTLPHTLNVEQIISRIDK